MSEPTEKCNHDKNLLCSLCSNEIPPSSTMGLAPSAPSGEEEARAWLHEHGFYDFKVVRREGQLPISYTGDSVLAAYAAHIRQQERERAIRTIGVFFTRSDRWTVDDIASAIRSQS